MTEPRIPDAIELTTRTGLAVRIRQARADDDAALRAGFAHLSNDSRYTRFFTAVPRLSGSLLRQLTDLDGRNRLAFAVFDPARDSEIGRTDGFGIAVARFIRPDPAIPVAELALAIIDEYHRNGLGQLLIAGLIVAADTHGIEQLQAFVLATNEPMIRLLASHGARELVVEEPGAGVRSYELDVSSARDSALIDPRVVTAFGSIA